VAYSLPYMPVNGGPKATAEKLLRPDGLKVLRLSQEAVASQAGGNGPEIQRSPFLAPH
jgi:hypothetical protein